MAKYIVFDKNECFIFELIHFFFTLNLKSNFFFLYKLTKAIIFIIILSFNNFPITQPNVFENLIIAFNDKILLTFWTSYNKVVWGHTVLLKGIINISAQHNAALPDTNTKWIMFIHFVFICRVHEYTESQCILFINIFVTLTQLNIIFTET